jgi:pyruvate/2-oxoglutarate dehydrogenase complex dihydrolipoamide dehydrogenase (E3) component
LGGGTSGIWAAREAAATGADVCVFERSQGPLPPKSQWPELLARPRPRGHWQAIPRIPGVEIDYGRPATSTMSGSRVFTPGGETRFDCIVFATGTRSLPAPFPGSWKRGVFILDSLPRYMELSRRMGCSASAVVCGKGLSAFKVADRLRGEGRKVTFLCPGRILDDGLSSVVRRLLLQRAAEAGVQLLDLSLDRAVGTDSVEAVIARGKVIRCDTLAVLPDQVPDFPHGHLETGPRGGILVDRTLRSNSGRCYAAGGCAEFGVGGMSQTMLLGRSAEASGRVAGANASGLKLPFTPASSIDAALFGLRFASAGLRVGEAPPLWMDAVETTWRRDSTSACSIVHDRLSGRVLGVQVLGPSSCHLSGFLSLVVTQSVRLSTLAYGDSGSSTDISLVAETASQGLAWRGRPAGQGPDLRPGGGREAGPGQGVRGGLQVLNQP